MCLKFLVFGGFCDFSSKFVRITQKNRKNKRSKNRKNNHFLAFCRNPTGETRR
jgi:hypothetical protein